MFYCWYWFLLYLIIYYLFYRSMLKIINSLKIYSLSESDLLLPVFRLLFLSTLSLMGLWPDLLGIVYHVNVSILMLFGRTVFIVGGCRLAISWNRVRSTLCRFIHRTRIVWADLLYLVFSFIGKYLHICMVVYIYF